MSSRYHGRRTRETSEKIYEKLLEDRDVKKIKHHTTPQLSHPTPEERRDMTERVHVWKQGDRYYKLAHQYYGDSRYWWVIAWWNLRPTEGHLNLGDGIRIPGPLERVMSILKHRRSRRGGSY